MRFLRVLALAMLTLCIVGCEREVVVFGVHIGGATPTTTPAPTTTASTVPTPTDTPTTASTPTTTSTATPGPTNTPTTIPSATAATTYIPVAPTIYPTAAAFPGDMTLTLSYELLPSPPFTVRFTRIITGGADNSFELYCGESMTDYGEGEQMIAIPECIPWTPDFRITRTSTFQHTYQHPGTYQVYIEYAADTRTDGTYLGVRRVLASNLLTVVIP